MKSNRRSKDIVGILISGDLEFFSSLRDNTKFRFVCDFFYNLITNFSIGRNNSLEATSLHKKRLGSIILRNRISIPIRSEHAFACENAF